MHKLINIYHQIADYVNEHAWPDATVGTSIGLLSIIGLSRDNVTFAGQLAILLLTILFLSVRIFFAYRKNKREEKESRLKEIEHENQNYEFRKRNGLD
jgi:cbb3-type cytochrome oxidase subunit 3